MDYEKVADTITERANAVVAVDLGARIQKVKGRVLVFAHEAHSLEASEKGKIAGEWADFTDFSFHAVKNSN